MQGTRQVASSVWFFVEFHSSHSWCLLKKWTQREPIDAPQTNLTQVFTLQKFKTLWDFSISGSYFVNVFLRKCLNISAFSRPYAGPPLTTSAQNGALNAPPGAWPNLYHHGSHEPMTVSPQAAGNSRSQMSGVFVSLGYPHHGLLWI